MTTLINGHCLDLIYATTLKYIEHIDIKLIGDLPRTILQ